MSSVDRFLPQRVVRTAAMVVVGLVVASCGGDDSGSAGGGSVATAPGAGEPLAVMAEDIDFPHDEYRVGAGEVDVVYENVGSIVHTLLIDGVEDFKLTVRSNGDVDEGTIDLEPGEYEMYCDIPGHQSAGMEALLVVS